MRSRRFWLVVVVLLLAPTPARADRHKWEAAAGVSRVNGSKLYGGSAAGAYVIKDWNLSFFADATKQVGSREGNDLSQFTGMGGVRFWMPLPIWGPKAKRKLLFFAQGTLGGVKSQGALRGWDVGKGGGVGLDVLFSEGGGLRGIAEKVWFDGNVGGTSFTRFFIGVVCRFEYDD